MKSFGRRGILGVLAFTLFAAAAIVVSAGSSQAAETATVTGTVYHAGVPLAGVEVWLDDGRYVCTNSDGEFSVAVPAGEPLLAATGPSVSAGCENEEFLDPDTGLPLVAQFWDHSNGFISTDRLGPLPPGGTVDIRFDVVHAVATQVVELKFKRPPASGIWFVKAFNRDDPGFEGTYGHKPKRESYPAIWAGYTGGISIGFVGSVSHDSPGVIELRYAELGDVLILVNGSLLDAQGNVEGKRLPEASFKDKNHDGVLEGRRLKFS